ncbi:MAG: hypothetical protein ACRDAX_07340 [Propionibacteriaceae bacterium]
MKDLFPKDEILRKYIDRLGELITDIKDPEKFKKFEYAVSGAFFSWVDLKIGRPKTWQMIKDAISTGNISESIAKPLGANTVAELMPEFRDWFSQLPS